MSKVPPSPESTKGAQNAGWAKSGLPSSPIIPSRVRRSTSVRPVLGLLTISRNRSVVSLTVAADETGQWETS